jgi:hypothetical protein
MADSADDLLARARQMRDIWLDAPDRSDAEFEGAQAMYRAFYDLDRLLSSGGPLPAAWADCAPARPVTDVPALSAIGTIGLPMSQRAVLKGQGGATWPTLVPGAEDDAAPGKSVSDEQDERAFDEWAAEIGRHRSAGSLSAVAHIQDQPSISGTGTLSFPASEIPDTWAFDEPGSERAALISGLAAAIRSMAGKDAEISRLTAELDAARNVPVEYVITAGLEAAMAADPHRKDGSVIRTTDGKREAYAWKAAAKTWEQVT